jgi:predicted enzyme related to lactoylglutathione lyase
MPKEKGESERDENYFCHIIIPTKDYSKSKVFFEKAFGWRVEAMPGTNTMDVLPPSGKGPSAELNSEEEVVMPSIHTSDIDRKLELIEEHGGKVLRRRAPIGEGTRYGYYALFEDPCGNRMTLYQRKLI